MQPTEIFSKTVRTGVPATKHPKTAQTPLNDNADLSHAPRDVVKVEIKLLLHWASRQLDQVSMNQENIN